MAESLLLDPATDVINHSPGTLQKMEPVQDVDGLLNPVIGGAPASPIRIECRDLDLTGLDLTPATTLAGRAHAQPLRTNMPEATTAPSKHAICTRS